MKILSKVPFDVLHQEIFPKNCWQFYRVCYNLLTNRTFVLCGSVLLFWKSQEWFEWMLVVKMREEVFLLSIVQTLFAIANGYCLHPVLKQKTSPLSFCCKEKLILVTWISFWFVRNANRKSVLSVLKNTQKRWHSDTSSHQWKWKSRVDIKSKTESLLLSFYGLVSAFFYL